MLAYLNAAAEAGTNDAQAIIRKLKEKPIDDALFGPVVVRPDGRAIHNMYILKVKDPKSSKGKWDMLENIGVLSGPEAFRPAQSGGLHDGRADKKQLTRVAAVSGEALAAGPKAIGWIKTCWIRSKRIFPSTATSIHAPKALDGIRVIDFSHFIAGPLRR